jgi:hypothetical protein
MTLSSYLVTLIRQADLSTGYLPLSRRTIDKHELVKRDPEEAPEGLFETRIAAIALAARDISRFFAAGASPRLARASLPSEASFSFLL